MNRIVLVLLVAASAAGQSREVTPFIGLQGGGALFIDREERSLDAGPVVGATLSFDRGRGRMLDFVVARQETEAGDTDVSVDVLQMGGRYFFTRDRWAMPYIAATIGGTRIAAGSAEAVRFSFAAGLGADLRLTPRSALRFDGRLYTTLFPDRAEFECRDAGVCVTGSAGEMFRQFIGSVGLGIRF